MHLLKMDQKFGSKFQGRTKKENSDRSYMKVLVQWLQLLFVNIPHYFKLVIIYLITIEKALIICKILFLPFFTATAVAAITTVNVFEPVEIVISRNQFRAK